MMMDDAFYLLEKNFFLLMFSDLNEVVLPCDESARYDGRRTGRFVAAF